eukprot:6426915-Pyramimonas_sp.AAC.1
MPRPQVTVKGHLVRRPHPAPAKMQGLTSGQMQDAGAPRNEIKTGGRSPLSGGVDRGRSPTTKAESTIRPEAMGR